MLAVDEDLAVRSEQGGPSRNPPMGEYLVPTYPRASVPWDRPVPVDAAGQRFQNKGSDLPIDPFARLPHPVLEEVRGRLKALDAIAGSGFRGRSRFRGLG